MRHEAFLMSEAESLAIIEQVNAWCRRTGSSYNKLVTAARVAPCTRSHVRMGKRRLTHQVAARLTATMQANPHGIAKDEHKRRVREVEARALARVLYQRRTEPPRVVDRSPCPRCGVRRDIGCQHFPAFESERARG